MKFEQVKSTITDYVNNFDITDGPEVLIKDIIIIHYKMVIEHLKEHNLQIEKVKKNKKTKNERFICSYVIESNLLFMEAYERIVKQLEEENS